MKKGKALSTFYSVIYCTVLYLPVCRQAGFSFSSITSLDKISA